MKKLLFSLALCFSTLSGFAQYADQLKTVNEEIVAKKKEIKTIQKELKKDKNNVPLHKAVVNLTVELRKLQDKKALVKQAQKQHNKLSKENAKFDSYKVKLLKMKDELEKMDQKLTSLFV